MLPPYKRYGWNTTKAVHTYITSNDFEAILLLGIKFWWKQATAKIYWVVSYKHEEKPISGEVTAESVLQKIIHYTRVGTLIVATIYLNWYKIDTCFEVLLSFNVVTSIVYNPLPAMWKS